MAKQEQVKWWEVTAKPDCPAIGGQTFRVQADSNLDAKSKVVRQEWGHMFTGLFRFMTQEGALARRKPLWFQPTGLGV